MEAALAEAKEPLHPYSGTVAVLAAVLPYPTSDSAHGVEVAEGERSLSPLEHRAPRRVAGAAQIPKLADGSIHTTLNQNCVNFTQKKLDCKQSFVDR